MPKFDLNDEMQNYNIAGSSFNFSGIRPENLGATEYTLVNILVDETGSVTDFKQELENAIKMAVDACKKSPRAENIMIRVAAFNRGIREIHGFKPLNAIDPNDYSIQPSGMTALYDATYDAVGAIFAYGKDLVENEYEVNGISFIITDGLDNMSSVSPRTIHKLIEDARHNEEIESILNILVGVNTQRAEVATQLMDFKDQAELDQYVDVGNATVSNLAKLAAFISKSTSSQSQSLGSGKSAPLSSLTF